MVDLERSALDALRATLAPRRRAPGILSFCWLVVLRLDGTADGDGPPDLVPTQAMYVLPAVG
jgi:hypothetical protein